MTQPSQLNIYFVLPKEDKEAECSRDMYDAFKCVKQYRGKPQWVLPSFCLSYTPGGGDVFVFDEFRGKAFEKLKKDGSKIIGAKCMLTCMSDGATIPPGTSPIFTEGMRDLIICCAGFDSDTRAHLQQRVEYMGGIFHGTLRSMTTHLVAHNTLSPKVIEAFKAGIPVMTEAWVEAVWKQSLAANVRGNNSEFTKYQAPLFHNLKITTTGIAKRKKENLKDLITEHGGIFTGTLEMNATNIVIIETPHGDKYKAAKEWKVACVRPSWIYQCVELRRIVPLANHGLEERSLKASTPNKDHTNADFTAHFSMVSAIEHEGKNVSRLEETTDVTASQPSASQTQRKNLNASVIDKMVQEALNAEQFLDGCNIFLHGFNQVQAEKLKRVLNIGGATRFDELTRSVTHIVVAVAGPVCEAFKESGAHVVRLEWLLESIALKSPAAVEAHIVGEACATPSAPPSPLSKQGALLLSRPEPRRIDLELNAAAVVEPELEEDDLVHRYNLSQQGIPLAERPCSNPSQPAERGRNVLLHAEDQRPILSQQLVNPRDELPPPVASFSSLRSDLTQTNTELFKGLKFFLSNQLSADELEGAENVLMRAGGTVVSRKFAGVPDYAVVPMAGAVLTEVTALEVVNLLFIRECVIENQIVPIQYYHGSIPWVLESAPLKGCVLCVSKYVGSERDFIEAICETLGATVQAILAKKDKNDIKRTTHLICPEPSGMKYNGAVRWGLPVVHHHWLMKCAELGKRISEESYILSENKSVASTNSNNATNLATSAKIRKPITSNASSTSDSRINNSEKDPKLNSVVNRPVAGYTESPRDGSDQSVRPVTPQSQINIVGPMRTPEVARSPLELTLTKAAQNNPSREVSQASSPPLPASRIPHIEVIASPINKALERLRNRETPKTSCSPDMNRTITPSSPYGACFGNDDPSPGTRKRLHKWMYQGANLPLDPPAKKQDTSRRDSTPVSELVSRQLRLMMRPPEDQPPDDSPEANPTKRFNINLSDSQSVQNDIINGLQKMREIEESYSRSNVAVPSPTLVSESEPRIMIVTESQPHTEIGWEDPSDREVALACLEKAADQIVERPPKIFMLSGLSETVDCAKHLIETSGGKMSAVSFFDRSATHLIAAASMTRAEKLMGSIAAGLWVLHPSYLEKLADVRDVYALKEEDFEWGNPRASMPLDVLPNNVRECVISAHHWRCDIQLQNRPPPFSGMKVILKIPPPKGDVFRRLFEAGGGQVRTFDTIEQGEKVFCLCDNTSLSKSTMENFAKKGICCVTTLFISDVIMKKATAVDDNMVSGFSEVWKLWQI